MINDWLNTDGPQCDNLQAGGNFSGGGFVTTAQSTEDNEKLSSNIQPIVPKNDDIFGILQKKN